MILYQNYIINFDIISKLHMKFWYNIKILKKFILILYQNYIWNFEIISSYVFKIRSFFHYQFLVCVVISWKINVFIFSLFKSDYNVLGVYKLVLQFSKLYKSNIYLQFQFKFYNKIHMLYIYLLYLLYLLDSHMMVLLL